MPAFQRLIKISLLTIFLLIPSSQLFALTWREYGSNMEKALARGTKKVFTSPLEIPKTIQEYQGKPGMKGILYVEGFGDGFLRQVSQLGSGLFDCVLSVLPGQQEGAG